MIVAFSTSSPLASAALISSEGRLLGYGEEEAPRAAGGACLRLLDRLLAETGLELASATLVAADLGPGSFTGVKVGVTLAKTFGFALGVPCAGLPSFDLVSPHETVAVPVKRGEWFVRVPGRPPFRATELPSGQAPVGYGPGFAAPTHPRASAFASQLASLTPGPPEMLVPLYLAEPSISTPNRPYGQRP